MAGLNKSLPVYVTISALNAGYLTLPENLFVIEAGCNKKVTIPSPVFFVKHPAYGGSGEVNLDHVGTPSDFANACFIIGSGMLHLLEHGAGPLYPTEIFNNDELPAVPYATKEESYDAPPHAPKHTYAPSEAVATLPSSIPVDSWAWEPLANFPYFLDLFDDGSVFVIDSLGHLYSYVNLLLGVAGRRFIYLGGDCCHDPRILSGQKGIALYDDGKGRMRSVDRNMGVAKKKLGQINNFMEEIKVNEDIKVELIVANDKT
ncbi:Uncharacterized protein HZ326_16560 [Fusarium oxysporum f. sp. albedinis]|nr:Uncharacterized protein HZ326_16560 [Fusarium oxysporum f. sp. albedinis]